MNKVSNKIKNNLFLSTIDFTLIFIFISFILYKCDILFRQWVYYLIGLIIYIGSIGGLIQLIRKIKHKILKAIISFIFILFVILFVNGLYYNFRYLITNVKIINYRI